MASSTSSIVFMMSPRSGSCRVVRSTGVPARARRGGVRRASGAFKLSPTVSAVTFKLPGRRAWCRHRRNRPVLPRFISGKKSYARLRGNVELHVGPPRTVARRRDSTFPAASGGVGVGEPRREKGVGSRLRLLPTPCLDRADGVQVALGVALADDLNLQFDHFELAL